MAGKREAELEMYPRQKWDDFLRGWNWKQGEHVMVCAPTGFGKTSLIARFLYKRSHVVVIGTKLYDDTYQDFLKSGFRRIEKWPPPRSSQRVLLWPVPKGKTIRENTAQLRMRMHEALNGIFRQRGWTTVIDETSYVANEMGLSAEIATYQHQGRSSGLTNVLGFQRPSHIPLIVYDSASHVFVSRSSLPQDAARLASLGGHNKERIGYTLARLGKYDFLYLATRDPEHEPVIVNTAH